MSLCCPRMTASLPPNCRGEKSIKPDNQSTSPILSSMVAPTTTHDTRTDISEPAPKKARRGSYVRRHALVGSSTTSTASLSDSTACLAALKLARKLSEECYPDSQQAGVRSSFRSKNNAKRLAMMLRGADTPRSSLSIRSSFGSNFFALSLDEK